MTKEELFQQIKKKRSYLCVGLDTDLKKIPPHLLKHDDPVFEFNRQIIEATAPYCVAYKPNLAFYEALGAKGWESLQKTLEIIPKEIFTIADAKRGDIGNTSGLYAQAFFEAMDFDALTVAPYMGADSVVPFLEYDKKWVVLLALTSNKSAADFQKLQLKEADQLLYQKVIETSQTWAGPDRMMYVVGATQGDQLIEIRKLLPDHFFIVPGVGAQGGSLQEVSETGMNGQCGLLVNSSRGIIYASNEKDFASAAVQVTLQLQNEMERYLDAFNLI